MANDPVSEKFDEICKKAEKLAEEKKYEDAIQLWKEAINLKPDDMYPYLKIGYIYLTEYKDFNNTLDIMLKMINNVPDYDSRYYLQIGYLYFQLNNSENAIIYYQKANDVYLENLSNLDNPLPENYFEAGFSYFVLKDYENCMNYYRKAYNILLDKLLDNNGSLNEDIFFSTGTKIYLLIHSISYNFLNCWENLNYHNYILTSINGISRDDKDILYSIGLLSALRAKCYEKIIESFENNESNVWQDKIPDIIYECVLYAYENVETNKEANFSKAKNLIIKQIINNPINERYYDNLYILPGYFCEDYQNPKPIECLSPEESKIIEDKLLKKLDRSPDNAELLYILGTFYYIIRKYEIAIQYLEKAIKINSNYQKLYKKLSIIYGLCLKTEEGLKTGIEYAEKYLSLKDDKYFEISYFRILKERYEELNK